MAAKPVVTNGKIASISDLVTVNAAESLPAQVEKADCACGQAAGSQHYTYHSAESCGVEPVESLLVEAKEDPLKTLARLLHEAGAIPVINGVRIEPKPTPSTPSAEPDDWTGIEHLQFVDGCKVPGYEANENILLAVKIARKQPQPDSSSIPEQTFESTWNKFVAANDTEEWKASDIAQWFWNAARIEMSDPLPTFTRTASEVERPVKERNK